MNGRFLNGKTESTIEVKGVRQAYKRAEVCTVSHSVLLSLAMLGAPQNLLCSPVVHHWSIPYPRDMEPTTDVKAVRQAYGRAARRNAATLHSNGTKKNEGVERQRVIKTCQAFDAPTTPWARIHNPTDNCFMSTIAAMISST